MGELKGLKIKNAVVGKVMTTDENGVAVSSDKDVQDIASATELSNVESRVTDTEANVDSLDQRISTLESDVQDISDAIEEINGEVVE